MIQIGFVAFLIVAFLGVFKWQVDKYSKREMLIISREVVSTAFLRAVCVAAALFVAGVSFYEFPPFALMEEPSQAVKGNSRLVVFEDGKVVHKAWGLWTIPGAGRAWAHVEMCHSLGQVKGAWHGALAEPQEVYAFRDISGALFQRKSEITLCISSLETFFADAKRRRNNSPEMTAAWLEADALAAKVLLVDAPGLEARYRMYEAALNAEMGKRGFSLSFTSFQEMVSDW